MCDCSCPHFQVITCPVCKGEGRVFEEDYYDDWYSGWVKCSRCDGKKLIKIDISKLND